MAKEESFYEDYEPLLSASKDCTPEIAFDLGVPLNVHLNRDLGGHWMWSNFERVCQRLRRPSSHVREVLTRRLGIQTVLYDPHRLLILGQVSVQQLSVLLAEYVDTYVRCATCQTTCTTLTIMPAEQVLCVQCLQCQTETPVKIRVEFAT